MRDRADSIWFDDRVEMYIDGDLDEVDRSAFDSRLRLDETLQSKVDFARQIKTSLADLPSPDLPATVLANVHGEIAKTSSYTLGLVGRQGQLRLVSRGVRRLGYTVVGIAACLALALVGPRLFADEDSQEPIPSNAEVEKALLEVKQTLAFVSDMGYERTEIVNGRVVEPVQKAMSFIFQPENPADIQ